MEGKMEHKRLESLDVLRGFDLFCLVGLEAIMHLTKHAIDEPWFNSFMWTFTHTEWEGFSPWDLVMPLFMFMAGVSIPFSLSRYKDSPDKVAVYRRIGKRVLLLWIFGMMCQGNLLALNPDKLFLFSNTLQSIAIGYLIAALLFLHTGIRTQIAVAVASLLAFWAAMEFITVGTFGGGQYTPDGNLAEWIDRVVLGRFRDASVVENGEVVFAPWYRYTWILSSINFGVTVLSGLFAGYILRKKEYTDDHKWKMLVLIGVVMVALGWIWGIEHPVIKKIWTSSMVLVSSGYCFMLMGLFYYWIDFKKHNKHTEWLKVYGMNSILAYMLTNIVRFHCIGESLLYGTEQFLGNYYPILITIVNVSVIYVLLYGCYKHRIFLRV